jgi:hypothetical protein
LTNPAFVKSMPALPVSQAKGRHHYNMQMSKNPVPVALAAAMRTGLGARAFTQTIPTTTIKG